MDLRVFDTYRRGVSSHFRTSAFNLFYYTIRNFRTMLWSLATLPHYNTENLPFFELIMAVANQTVGDAKSRFILFFVPALTLLVLARGPTLKGPYVKKD